MNSKSLTTALYVTLALVVVAGVALAVVYGVFEGSGPEPVKLVTGRDAASPTQGKPSSIAERASPDQRQEDQRQEDQPQEGRPQETGAGRMAGETTAIEPPPLDRTVTASRPPIGQGAPASATPPAMLRDRPAVDTGGDRAATASPSMPRADDLQFDVVRVEPDGSAVLAGRAAPNSRIGISVSGRVVATTDTDASGQWVIVLDEPLPGGTSDISIVSMSADDRPVAESAERLAVVVPEDGAGEVLIVKQAPDRVSEVIARPRPGAPAASAPDAGSPSRQRIAALDEGAVNRDLAPPEPATGPEVATKGEPRPTSGTGERVSTGGSGAAETPEPPRKTEPKQEATPARSASDAAKPEAAAGKAAPETGVSSSEAPPQKQGAEKQGEEKLGAEKQGDGKPQTRALATPERMPTPKPETGLAAGEATGGREAETGQTVIAARQPAETPLPTPKGAPKGAGESGPDGAGERAAPPAPAEPVIGIEVVEVENDRIRLSGIADAGGVVRVYVDNLHIGDARVRRSGRWSLSVRAAIAIGRHNVRVDSINADSGKVVARAEVPFVQEFDEAAIGKVEVTARGEAQIAELGAAAGHTTAKSIEIHRGDNLWRIARRLWGRGIRYTAIYDANRSQIRNPNLIYPGQIFLIPRVAEADDARATSTR